MMVEATPCVEAQWLASRGRVVACGEAQVLKK